MFRFGKLEPREEERNESERERAQPALKAPKAPKALKHPSQTKLQLGSHYSTNSNPFALAIFMAHHTHKYTCNAHKAIKHPRNQTWFQTTTHRALNAPRANE